jgi:hypothetical protein
MGGKTLAGLGYRWHHYRPSRYVLAEFMMYLPYIFTIY